MRNHQGWWALVFLICSTFAYPPPAFSKPDPAKLLEQMDGVMRGNSHEMLVTLDVKTRGWERHYKIKVWMKGIDLTFARVLEPPKSEGQGFLRIKTRLWNFLPTAERTILIPPSMMLDKFMGSDFSNDDFVKLSYLPRDYDGTIVDEQKIDSTDTYHLELLPRPDAPVTYGKLEIWLRKSDSAPVRTIFYNEALQPIRTLHYSKFKNFAKREVPTEWRMENLKDQNRRTTVTILEAAYDIDLPESIFTKENLEKYS